MKRSLTITESQLRRIIVESVNGAIDAEYMDAVKNNDMERASELVMAYAGSAMPDTKIVENGRLLPMSHCTNNEGFHTFDKSKIGSGQGQMLLGAGFNFSRGYGDSRYGKRTIMAFLNAENPLTDTKVTLSKSTIKKLMLELNRINGVDRIEYNWDEDINRAVNRLHEYSEGDLDIYAGLCLGYSGEGLDVMNLFLGLGFDSVIEHGDDGKILSAVMFNPNQIKSADPVTYDGNGNVIPLSKRFDMSNSDIRY